MNIEKLIQTCNYILRKHDFAFNYTKLIKLLYLADKESLKFSNQTITGDTYVSMDNGPVLSQLYDLIKNKCTNNTQELWNSRFIKNEFDLIAITNKIPDSELSKFEKRILDEIDERFKDYNYGKMINFVHNNCPEWKAPQGSSVPIDTKDILRSIGKTEDEINWIIEEQEAFEAEEAIFQTLAV